jgi:hypothetical protein
MVMMNMTIGKREDDNMRRSGWIGEQDEGICEFEGEDYCDEEYVCP